MHPLEKMFRPRSVAVVGASGDPEKLGGRTLLHLKELGYQGRIYPINVSAKEVQGLPAWRSVADLPETPDCALILLPAPLVAQAIEDCAARGVKFAQVLSSGFAEEGGEGVAMQARLGEQARAHGIRLTGPNCLGSISPPDGFFGTFSSLLATAKPPPGSVGVATQSGAYGSHIYAVAGFRGIGISRAIATGNEVDIDVAEAIDYLADDPGTRVICASLEGCGNGDGLRRALLKAAALRKPVIIMKVGSSEVGAAAAATHTGSLAGEDRVIDTVFRECGALRVSSIEEMLDVAYLCAIAPLPPLVSAGIVSVSGGIGVLMADACIEAGLSVPALSVDALDAIRAVQPMAGGRNPIDTTAQLAGRLHVIETISQSMMGGADLGALFFYLAHLGRDMTRFPKVEGAFLALRRRQPDRTVVAVMTHIDEVRQQLEAMGVPVFEDPTRAVRAVAGAARLRRLQAEAEPVPGIATAAPLGMTVANEAQAKALLAAAGVSVLPEEACAGAEAAVAAADRLGYPVVMKILSDDIPHKTEVGGVMLNVADGTAVRAAFATLTERAGIARPDARLDGVLVAPMARGGVETIIGTLTDPVFGPMVMFGLGGVAVELFRDVAFASAPLTPQRAEALIDASRGAALLKGWRGGPALDRAALVEALCALSRFAAAHADEIDSVEVNPFLVRETGACALDALVAFRAED
ncbi:acetate--CoA ligase family protein [Neoroseomonas lacus]|uniref:6-carboxyhexanoate--CoA ligase n=1 Tax=Neoroseomonas lacus TaxID=287609 RepID=A0A917L0D0_9PROT|nr:acetate--CoA ligase family protein [Neoroseomonas lacus]GGJ33658.1 6-carboxyhexanoate--CoA ligase [Neoroseomonas lacus]